VFINKLKNGVELEEKFKIYTDHLEGDERPITLKAKLPDEVDQGIIYAPYIPIMKLPSEEELNKIDEELNKIDEELDRIEEEKISIWTKIKRFVARILHVCSVKIIIKK